MLNKKWIYFALAVFVASFMHKSALLLLPLGILIHYIPNRIPNVKIQLLIVAISYLLMDKFENVLSVFSSFAAYAGYSETSIDAYTLAENRTLNFGFRMWLLYFTYIIAIIYSDKMNTLFNSCFFIHLLQSRLFQ